MNTHDTAEKPATLAIHSPTSLAARSTRGLIAIALRNLAACGVLGLVSGVLAQNPDLPFVSGSTGADGPLILSGSATRRIGHALAYDAARGRVVLFGGELPGSKLADTWEWDGIAWTLKTPAVSPPGRSYHALAYDSNRQRVVLFGGWNGTSVFVDTWEWDGTAWTQQAPATSPSARYFHALTYDAARQRVVLFGGTDNTNIFADTWDWDGITWTQKPPAASPSPRYLHALAYDSQRQRVVLFGGYDTGRLGDTWEWDGTTWMEKPPATPPSPRYLHDLAYDSQRQRVVLFGGYTGAVVNDTWEWDGVGWTQKSPATLPDPRQDAGLAYDSARQRVVLFGGINNGNYFADTWEWDGTNWVGKISATTYQIDMTTRPNGVWNYSSIVIPNNVTVTFNKNAANTPVTWLATGNVQIDGNLDVSGTAATGTNVPERIGKGGPAGFDGGMGGTRFVVSNSYIGLPGQGPGGGMPGTTFGQRADDGAYRTAYGNIYLQPLIGGSGGGGGPSDTNIDGCSGGGGGGAILVASSKNIVVNGSIKSKGGVQYQNFPNNGGNGSGGAVRLVADRVIGAGLIDVDGSGRIRIEAFFRSLAGNNNSTPASGAAPVATSAPSTQGQLIISNVAGQNIAQPPTGNLTNPDVVFTQAGQITVTVSATDIPDGTPVRLRITTSSGIIAFPATGAPAVNLATSTATFTATVPAGLGTIQAFADYTVP